MDVAWATTSPADKDITASIRAIFANVPVTLIDVPLKAPRKRKWTKTISSTCRFAQTCGSYFRRDISLRRPQHLKSHHEFANGRRPQERWIKMGMEVPFRVILAIGWRLMEAHRIGKGDIKHLVVGGRHRVENLA